MSFVIEGPRFPSRPIRGIPQCIPEIIRKQPASLVGKTIEKMKGLLVKFTYIADLFEDCLAGGGPDERSAVGVIGVDKGFDFGDEVFGADE
jgi:hypothetical protein